MTKITREDVDKLADLSRIEMTDAEKEEIQKDLESILGYVSELQEVAAQEPPVAERIGMLKNVMRDDGDAHTERTYTKEMIGSAPASEGDFVKVKKILG
jgi:aspartyl-tRNA(Asn)/glutamyl-tRNA(Gln) amidotransferase subunit C